VYAFRAGFVVCLHTLNLRKDDEPYIGVVVFRKIPLTNKILHKFRLSFVNNRFNTLTNR